MTNFTSTSISTTSLESNNEPQVFRLYLGGFQEPITSLDILHLFRSFGSISNVHVPISKNGTLRSFVHFDLHCTPSTFSKCISTLNKTRWKGGRLHLQLAQPKDYTAFASSLSSSNESSSTPSSSSSSSSSSLSSVINKSILDSLTKSISKKPCSSTLHRYQAFQKPILEGTLMNDLSLVNEDHLPSKLWKRGRFGRPMALMRRMPTNQLHHHITVDPMLYKHQIERLYLNPKPTPIEALTWEYTSSDQVHPPDLFSFSNTTQTSSLVDSSHNTSSLDRDHPPSPLHTSSVNTLSSMNAIPFIHDELESVKEETGVPPTLTLFEETDVMEESLELETVKKSFEKRQFENSLDPTLLDLQLKSKGDPRFQFTEEFASTPASTNTLLSSSLSSLFTSLHDTNTTPCTTQSGNSSNSSPIEEDLKAEKELAKKVLKDMFGSTSIETMSAKSIPNTTTITKTSSSLNQSANELFGIQFYEPPSSTTTSSSSSLTTTTSTTTLQESVTNTSKLGYDLASVFTKHGPSMEAKTFTLFDSTGMNSNLSTTASPSTASDAISTTPFFLNLHSVPSLPKTTLMSPVFFQYSVLDTIGSFRKDMSLGQRTWWWKQHRSSLLQQIKRQHSIALQQAKKKKKMYHAKSMKLKH